MKNIQLDSIIKKIIGRDYNLFKNDYLNNIESLKEKINKKSVLVIGGAGTIGSYFIKEILKFEIKRLYVVDTNENGLAELVRDIRSSNYKSYPVIKTYSINYSSKILSKIMQKEKPFEIIANFAALKHVRSEKDEYSIEAMFENNFIHASNFIEEIIKIEPENFFCVSTDKATNPVSIMGATKKIMEDIIFSYKNYFNITTARFANVAFSNGSLLESYIFRFNKNQPIVCPKDIHRYFISGEEAGLLCLLACFLGNSSEIFIPKLSTKQLTIFPKTIEYFFNELGLNISYCETDIEAKEKIVNQNINLNKEYPVYLFNTDTSGEKLYEEFYTDDDIVNWERFESIGIISHIEAKKFDRKNILKSAEKMFSSEISKKDIIKFLNRFVVDFEYIDKNKYLDDKM